MTWAAITAGHWGFFGLGMLFTTIVGVFALGFAAAAKQGDQAMEFDNPDDAIAWLTDGEGGQQADGQ